MIPFYTSAVHPKSWQQQYADSITDPQELLRLLDLPAELLPGAQLSGKLFPLRVTHDYLDCIEKANPEDPLLRQVLPLAEEMQPAPGYTQDPVGDRHATVSPGLIHKYHGRVLLITTPACAIHCRYCFRREYPYQASSAHGRQLEQALDYIEQHHDIHEVILSGGDPLSLSDRQLDDLLQRLAAIRHVNSVRLHSRLPVVLPNRVNQALLQTLSRTRLHVVLVIHSNHPQEISAKVMQALGRLKAGGILLLNQSVLLKKVNDEAETLIHLSHKLFGAGVLPYYLHLLDKVTGTRHFAVSDSHALRLYNSMRKHLPGYLTPRLVRETAGATSKENMC